MTLDDMSINELVSYINVELQKGRTLKDIELKDFGVNEGVIRKRLMRKSYKRIDNTFVLADEVIQKHNNSISIDNKLSKEVIQKHNKDIDIDKLKELIELIEPIKALIQKHNNDINIVDVKPIELRPKAIREVKQKLFKIDVDVLEQWEKFVSNHKEFKVQQLISLALEEFIHRYE